MTQYDAEIWPPLVFPDPTPTGDIGGTFEPPPAPPAVIPDVQSTTGNGGTADPPAAPSMVPPEATTSSVSFTPAALAVASQDPDKVVNPYTTQDQINSFFRIVSPRPGSGS